MYAIFIVFLSFTVAILAQGSRLLALIRYRNFRHRFAAVRMSFGRLQFFNSRPAQFHAAPMTAKEAKDVDDESMWLKVLLLREKKIIVKLQEKISVLTLQLNNSEKRMFAWNYRYYSKKILADSLICFNCGSENAQQTANMYLKQKAEKGLHKLQEESEKVFIRLQKLYDMKKRLEMLSRKITRKSLYEAPLVFVIRRICG